VDAGPLLLRNSMRFGRALSQGHGALIERDHDDQWDVWPSRSDLWDDAYEVESRR
jgi:hypothetical protein